MMCGDRVQQPCGDSIAKPRPHSTQRKSHSAYERATVSQIELKRNDSLQRFGIHLVMNHERPHPIGDEKGFDGQRKQPLASGFTQRCFYPLYRGMHLHLFHAYMSVNASRSTVKLKLNPLS